MLLIFSKQCIQIYKVFVNEQIEQKHSALVDQADVNRNMYLLSITSTNAHMERYYQTDLSQLIKVCFCIFAINNSTSFKN